VEDQEDEMEEEDELQEDDAGEDAGMMESEIIEDVSGGMTAEGRKRQKRQTMPYMTKYERARILGSVPCPLPHRCCCAQCSRGSSSCCCEGCAHRSSNYYCVKSFLFSALLAPACADHLIVIG
jgi:hypothetical protein